MKISWALSAGALRQLRILQTPADYEAVNYRRSSGRLTCNDSFNFLVCNSPAGAIALPSLCSDCENFSKLHFNFENFRRAKNVLVKKFCSQLLFWNKTQASDWSYSSVENILHNKWQKLANFWKTFLKAFTELKTRTNKTVLERHSINV